MGLIDVSGGLNEGTTGLAFLTGGFGAPGGLGGPTIGGGTDAGALAWSGSELVWGGSGLTWI